MTEQEIITKVIAANNVAEVFDDIYEWKKTYKMLCKIHPDLCNLPGASEAFTKLNGFKHELDSGNTHQDDAGTVTYAMKKVIIKGDPDLIKKSFDNYNKLMALTDSASGFFKHYLPVSGDLVDGELIFTLPYRGLPVSALGVQEQKHANWALSRMLEFAGWIEKVGFSHAGINPESMYILPENHGLICISFYHMTPLGSKLDTVSGKYQTFYPSKVFTDKLATVNIDIELAKRTAIYLLGDRSGSGVRLRKTHNEEILDFLNKSGGDTFSTYQAYRALLKKHFDTNQFHKLII